MNRPLCFVLMPFGKKPNTAGSVVDFDAVYRDLIAPTIAEAGLEPLRADEEMTGGIIHKLELGWPPRGYGAWLFHHLVPKILSPASPSPGRI